MVPRFRIELAASAFGAQDLARQGTQTLDEIAEQVPNLTLEVSRG